jgi:hypothetical protein
MRSSAPSKSSNQGIPPCSTRHTHRVADTTLCRRDEKRLHAAESLLHEVEAAHRGEAASSLSSSDWSTPANSRPPQNCRPLNSLPTTSKSTNASPSSSRMVPIPTNEPAVSMRYRSLSTSRATMPLKRRRASTLSYARS